ncbi:MAG: helix-turn-helix domain-containing protein [Nitrospirae bacterium]|nr:helix-turn-helix domain-containing protein [Nitrospirota bacterium]
MDTPGKILKAEREKRSLSLKEISANLKVSQAYLRALEEEKYEQIPGEVFVKGYLRLYSRFLGLDGDYILSLLPDETKPMEIEEKPPRDEKKPLSHSWHLYLIILIISTIAVVSLFFFTTQISKYETPPPVIEQPAQPRIETTTPELIQPEQEQSKQPPAKLSLKITAIEDTWLLVSPDGQKPSDVILMAGESAEWEAIEGFSIKIGNAGGVKLYFNGKDLGPIGSKGEVVTLKLPGHQR